MIPNRNNLIVNSESFVFALETVIEFSLQVSLFFMVNFVYQCSNSLNIDSHVIVMTENDPWLPNHTNTGTGTSENN